MDLSRIVVANNRGCIAHSEIRCELSLCVTAQIAGYSKA